ncbi:MAG: KpsF/GutQ family sugar-phosphate isomerase, partial [Deltaproteobacteria bacterium]
ISYSGETDELIGILPMVKRLGVSIISMTGNMQSTLARASDVVLDLNVPEEACPLGLAPTASTTATLAMGDALAVALLEKRGFRESDFALLHPGGTLGRKLLFKVKDLMKVKEEIPLVKIRSNMRETLMEITSKHLGTTGVVDDSGKLVGIITDGDLRRCLRKTTDKTTDFFNQTAADLMTKNPKTIDQEELASKALHIMEKHTITCLFVVDSDAHPAGILHLHDLIRVKVV